MDVPAVVGSFPEPFLHGTGGKRLPVRVECSPADAPGCKQVSDLLGKAGVIAARGGLAASFTKETLRILVGLWPAIHEDPARQAARAGAADERRVRADGARRAVARAARRRRATSRGRSAPAPGWWPPRAWTTAGPCGW